MLSLNNLKADFWSRRTSKRLWRWNGSWKWTTSWRWSKWQNSWAWGWVAPWFEWGQTPLFRRIPKLRGFSNAIFKVKFNIINISDLNKLIEVGITEIDKDALLASRIIRNKNYWVKLLSEWELKWKVTIKVNKASAEALKKVEAAWGKVEIL
jgi:large subunit ribosomal protein L15